MSSEFCTKLNRRTNKCKNPACTTYGYFCLDLLDKKCDDKKEVKKKK